MPPLPGLPVNAHLVLLPSPGDDPSSPSSWPGIWKSQQPLTPSATTAAPKARGGGPGAPDLARGGQGRQEVCLLGLRPALTEAEPAPPFSLPQRHAGLYSPIMPWKLCTPCPVHMASGGNRRQPSLSAQPSTPSRPRLLQQVACETGSRKTLGRTCWGTSWHHCTAPGL